MAGVDLFLADVVNTGRGLGVPMLEAFVRMIAELTPIRSVRVDPHPENARAIRCFEKAGFRHTKTGPGWEGAPAYFMELDVSDR